MEQLKQGNLNLIENEVNMPEMIQQVLNETEKIEIKNEERIDLLDNILKAI